MAFYITLMFTGVRLKKGSHLNRIRYVMKVGHCFRAGFTHSVFPVAALCAQKLKPP